MRKFIARITTKSPDGRTVIRDCSDLLKLRALSESETYEYLIPDISLEVYKNGHVPTILDSALELLTEEELKKVGWYTDGFGVRSERYLHYLDTNRYYSSEELANIIKKIIYS